MAGICCTIIFVFSIFALAGLETGGLETVDQAYLILFSVCSGLGAVSGD